MTREITHVKAFQAALDSLVTDPFPVGNIPPTPGLVDEHFDTSTSEGDEGKNMRGPWNEGNENKIVEAPAFQSLKKFIKSA